MIRVSEYVSLGHPDKIADYISQYLLDRYIEQDPYTRYAVEVQIKDWHVTLGGEVSSSYQMTDEEMRSHIAAAVNDIGYTREYQEKWGHRNTISGSRLDTEIFISKQSSDIAQGVLWNGWGDQGIFHGMATYNPKTYGMPYDHTVAKRLCKALFESGLGGLDIKTQVVTDNDVIAKIIVAIPLLPDQDTRTVEDFVHAQVEGNYELIINGTGRYVRHSSLADCGTTGRKLAVDFYGGNCIIGGGSPWTKDGTKADLTLNLYARQLALINAAENHCDVDVALACCIGKKDVDFCVRKREDGRELGSGVIQLTPASLISQYGLDKPIYASMCRWGLFGEFQQDKAWENCKDINTK